MQESLTDTVAICLLLIITVMIWLVPGPKSKEADITDPRFMSVTNVVITNSFSVELSNKK